MKDLIKKVLTTEEQALSFYGSDQFSKLPTYQEISKRLLEALNVFITGFEMYLRDYVSHITPKITENIKYLVDRVRLEPHAKVLNFNYTNTFANILKTEGLQADFCNVHGAIGDGTKNTMVLGINEYLSDDKLDDFIVFAPFRKYNQRIFKGTNSSYMDWLDVEKENNPDLSLLYIFGHSLGLSDRDILHDFIMSPGMHTTVFYHGEKTFSEQVGNLTAIIGKNEMIKRTGGQFRTLEFMQQK